MNFDNRNLSAIRVEEIFEIFANIIVIQGVIIVLPGCSTGIERVEDKSVNKSSTCFFQHDMLDIATKI